MPPKMSLHSLDFQAARQHSRRMLDGLKAHHSVSPSVNHAISETQDEADEDEDDGDDARVRD